MPKGPGTYGSKVGRPPKKKGAGKAMSTADFTKKINAIKANTMLTAAQKKIQIDKMLKTRAVRKKAGEPMKVKKPRR
jgi:hypothetical protein